MSLQDLEIILMKGKTQMEVCLRELELAIALTELKRSLIACDLAKKRYDEVLTMTPEEKVSAWSERVRLR